MRIRIIDAFTDRAFAGNPAGVCLLDTDAWPQDEWMRQVAAELNLSETAFARPVTGDPDADWALRWFTPTVEVKLCGHATLATAHALHSDSGSPGTVRFTTRSGVLVAHAGADATITLDFPVATPVPATPPAGVVEALGAQPDAVLRADSLGDLLAVFTDETTVRTLRPDLSALTAYKGTDGIRGFIVTAPAVEPGNGYDFVSRFFAPADGIPEDPVTGGAHTVLAPYWTDRLGRTSLTGLQVSARTGVVGVSVHADRVHLVGRAVTVLDGTLSPPAASAQPG